MNKDEEEITVFKTSETDSFVKAVALLDASEISYRIVDRNEGGYRIPRRIHEILVLPVDTEEALSILADIPTETFLTQMSGSVSPEYKSISWGYLIILVMVVLFGVIMAVLKSNS